MTGIEAAPSVSEFFGSYRAAFEGLDAAAITEHFAFPIHVTSDPGEPAEVALTAVATREEWAGQLERLLAMYRTIGVRTARVEGLATVELSPRLVQSVVHWELRGAPDQVLYDFDATYTLARIGGTLRVTALAHNEIPRYRACLARLQAER